MKGEALLSIDYINGIKEQLENIVNLVMISDQETIARYFLLKSKIEFKKIDKGELCSENINFDYLYKIIQNSLEYSMSSVSFWMIASNIKYPRLKRRQDH